MALKILMEKRKTSPNTTTLPKGVVRDALIAYLMPFDNRGKEITDIEFAGGDLEVTIQYRKETKSRTRKDYG